MSPFAILATLLLLLHSPLSGHSSSASNGSIDHLALLSFKSLATTTSSPQALSTWNDTLTFCGWPGVLCNDTQHPGRVTHLRLGSFNLSGTISPSLSNLTFLTTLNLSYNSLHGSIPPEVGLLARLEYLNLRGNSLGGEIPQGLTRHCSNLNILYLEKNGLRGPIPTTNLSRCTNLEYLFLSNNKLGGGIPSELGGLPRLLRLRLDRNNLTGQMPPSLGNISTLTDLYLSFNNLEGSIPVELGRLAGLYTLDLAYNRFTGRIPSALYNFSSLYGLGLGSNNLSGPLPLDFGAKLPALAQVYLFDNQLDGPIPPSITNASAVTTLSLSNNKFSGTVPKNLGSLALLERLQLGQNRLEATGPDDWSFITSLTNCTGLFELDISKNNFGGSLPESIGNLSVKMTFLGMGYNKIAGGIPSGIANLVSLQVLDWEKGLFSGSIPGTIGKLKNLRIISLAKNRLSGVIPSSMGNLSHLLKLYLNENILSGVIPVSLASLKKLDTLDLSYNHLTGNVPKGLFGISTLSFFLNISHNSLEGRLPDAFESLINLVAIDVSGNKFSGGIPLSLGGCQLLESLNLGDNEFTGTIPGSLGDIKGILSLNLSENHLSGPIPKFLELSFPALRFLNLSFNDFKGELPTDGLFRNSSLFSVVGNERLCGGIPELQLRACSGNKNGSSRTLSTAIIVAVVALIFLMVSLFLLRKCVCSRTSKKAPNHHDPENELFLKVSYGELVTATNRFSPTNLIGQGGFGKVYRGILQPEQIEVAVKVLNQNMVGFSKSFTAECDVLRGIRHRNLVRIITSCSTLDVDGNEFKALVYEFLPNGSLDAWLHPDVIVGSKPRNLNVLQMFRIAMDIASALDYLHNQAHEPIVHCDLKPSNILLRDDMTACIGDFGIARFLSTNVGLTSGIKGSIGYIAPECSMGSPISPLWDIYSYGILLLEMFTGKKPTDETFTGGVDLHEFVNACFPNRIIEIIDPKLLPERGHNLQINKRIGECLMNIMEVALICSRKLPTGRMYIHDVNKYLNVISDVISDLEEV